MIRQNETTLTAEQYQAIQAGTFPHASQVIAHRYNPKFEMESSSHLTADNLSQDFDVVLLNNNTFLKVADTSLEKWDPSTDTWSAVAGFTAPVNPLDTSMAITVAGTTVSVYACTLSGLQVNTSTNNGVTWSGWSMFYANPSGSPTGNVYGSDITAGQTFASSGTNHGNAYDNNSGTYWEAGTNLAIQQYTQVTFGVSRAITRYSMTAPSTQALADRMPRSWNVYAGSTVVHTVITEPWTAGEKRHFSIQAEAQGVGSVSNTVWKIGDLYSFTGQPVVIQEIEMMETTTTGVPEIVHVAADRDWRIHFVVKDNAKHLYNFRLSVRNGSVWNVTASDIWWQYDIESFQVAVVGVDDILVFTSDVPGTITAVQKDDGYINKFYVSGGINAIVYRNGHWSQHIPVDVVDNVSNYRWREYMKASAINGGVYVTCFGSEGTEAAPVEAYRCYYTEDGYNWSVGEIMPMPDLIGGYGMKLRVFGDTIYGFEKQDVYSSPMTLYFGSSPAGMQTDISERVMRYSMSQSNAMSASLVIDNQDGYFDNHAIISEDNTILLYHYAGIYIDGAPATAQVAISEVDAIQFSRNGAMNVMTLATRDKFSWMADKTVSEQSVYRKSQLQGGDKYTDYSDTARGGMSNTARQTGAWRTEGGWLRCDSNFEEAIVFSAFSPDMWNGSISTAVITTSNASTVYFGVVFRAVDASNLLYAVYKYSTQRFHLYERRNGVDTQLAQSASTYNFSNADILRHIKVECDYGQIRVYYASSTANTAAGFDDSAGRTWSLVISHQQSAARYTYDGTYIKTVDQVPLTRGYMGLIMYSAERSRFWRTEIHDFELPNTIEDSFRWYASMSKMQAEFDKLYRPTNENWTLDTGLTINAYAVDTVWDNGESLWDDGITFWL